jgi:hypothetical protein
LQLIVDSTDSLEDAMRSVGALYGVALVLAEADRDASAVESVDSVAPAQTNSAVEPVEPNGTVKPRKAGRRRQAPPGKRSQSAAAASGPDGEKPEEPIADPHSLKPPSNIEVRSWARAHGFTVSDRGRVPASVAVAYRKAHQK